MEFIKKKLFRFRGQTQLYKSKPSEFQMAIEEALLAENGILDSSFGSGQTTNSEAYPVEFQGATDLCREQEYYSQNQVNSLNFLLPSLFYHGHSTLRIFWLYPYNVE